MDKYAEKSIKLSELSKMAETCYIAALAKAKASGVPTPVRHKCFVCYHSADIDFAFSWRFGFGSDSW